MKPVEFAAIGVRLIGLALIAFGATKGFGDLAMSSLREGVVSSLHLQDTYYVTGSPGIHMVGPSGAAIVLGSMTLVVSRTLARWLVNDLDAL